MKLGKLGKIESIPSPRARDHGADNLFFDAKTGRLVATDGHCMVIASVEPGPDDTSGYIPAEAMKYARETLRKAITTDSIEIKVNGNVSVIDKANRSLREFHRPEAHGFPNYAAVVPKVSGPPTCTFDYALLKKVVDALGDADYSGAPKSLAMWITAPNKPIVVKTTGSGPIGILMPVRIDTTGWAITVEAVEERAAKERQPKESKIAKLVKTESKARPPRAEVVPIKPNTRIEDNDGPQAA